MSDCITGNKIIVVKGDDTNWNNSPFLRINFNTETLDLSTFKAVFSLCGITKQFNDLSAGYIYINLTSQETSQMPFGDNYGVLKLIDNSNRITTIESLIPFCFVSVVHDNSILTTPFNMDVKVEQGGENILNIDFSVAGTPWGSIYGDIQDQEDLMNALDGKQNVIQDLDTIRAGAALGATALQPDSPLNGANLTNGSVVKEKLSQAVQTSLGLADTAVQTNDLATVAFSGSYNDLQGKPTIGNATLTIQKNSTTVDTFTANATENKTINISVPTKTSDITNDSGFATTTEVGSDISTHNTSESAHSYIQGLITTETGNRELADTGLQRQIDAITASSDVKDIVGTYAALQEYDTSTLGNNDIIKVLQDETHDDETTYYRWVITNGIGAWVLIGEEGPYLTPSAAASTYVPLTRTVNGKALSANISLTASDVGALPSSTVIPTVNDETLTIQKNGSTVATFTANSNTATTANITVPTQPSDIGAATAAQGAKADTALQNTATGTNSLTVLGTPATGDRCFNIGIGSSSASVNSTAVGLNSSAAAYSAAFGCGAVAGGSGTAIGQNASASGGYAVALGDTATADGQYSIAIGVRSIGAYAQNYYDIAIGGTATGNSSIAIGAGATASGNGAIQIGRGVNSSNATVQFGSYSLLDSSGKLQRERFCQDDSSTYSFSGGTVVNDTVSGLATCIMSSPWGWTTSLEIVARGVVKDTDFWQLLFRVLGVGDGSIGMGFYQYKPYINIPDASGDFMGVTTYSANDIVWLKLVWLNNTWTLYSSTNGTSWTQECTRSGIARSGVPAALLSAFSSPTVYYADCYIKSDGETIWSGEPIPKAPLASTSLFGFVKPDGTTITISSGVISANLSGCQTTSNLVTSISSQSTDTEYPSAKCVYDIVGNIETLLHNINSGS